MDGSRSILRGGKAGQTAALLAGLRRYSEERILRRVLLHLCLAVAALGAGTAATKAQSAPTQQPTEARPASPARDRDAGQQSAACPTPAQQRLEAPAAQKHRFWDNQNSWLFAGVGASRALDYFSTLNMRQRGRQEILLTNDLVDNHAAFAGVEAAGTGLSIAASYVFHRYHHHALERWTSYIHIGLATGGAVRNYCLKTAHSAATVPHP